MLSSRKRIFIADDHALFAEGIATMLSAHYDVVGTASNGRQLVQGASLLRPDLILLDVSMPDLNGIEAARQLQHTLPTAKLVFVTQQISPQYLYAAFQAGAVGYVAKQSAPRELLTALQQIVDGGTYITALLEEKVAFAPVAELKQKGKASKGELTTRQREVLQLIAEGKTSREIALRLNISPKTVEFHKKALTEHTGLRSAAELTRYAISNGIVALE